MSVATSYNGSRLDDSTSRDHNGMRPRIPDTPPDSIGHIHEMSHLKNYEIIEKLGQGTFGVVQKAKRKSDGSIVAIKQLLNHSVKEGFPITAMREITILKQLNHSNILRILDMIFEEPKVNNQAEIMQNRGSFYTVSPYMSSDLVGLLENPNIKLELNQIKCIVQQLFTGIQYIHDNNYLHRDIKAANILIDQYGVLKIADFGLARLYHGSPPRLGMGPGGGERSYTGLVVTRWYRPPEILLGERKYTTAVDIWGIGCVFAELFTGRPILVGKTDADQAKIVFELMGSPITWTDASKLPHKAEYSSGLNCKRTLESRFEKIMPPDAIKLLSGLLTLDPYKRLNALDALNHEFFKNDPLPLLPNQMPKYEESHEIDKEKFKKMKDRNYPVSDLKPPTEIQYGNHSESRQNTVHSAFGGGGGAGDRENRYSSGKSEYNFAGKLRHEQYGQKSQHDSYYLKSGYGDQRPQHHEHHEHHDYRGRHDYQSTIKQRQDYDYHDRYDNRDSYPRDSYDTKDQNPPPTTLTVGKIRESGDAYHGKYENYKNYNEKSKAEPPKKILSSLPPKPEVPSRLDSKSMVLPRVSSSNAIKIPLRDNKITNLSNDSVKVESLRNLLASEKENVETKEDKKTDQNTRSTNGVLSPKKRENLKATSLVKIIESVKKEEPAKKVEPTKTAEPVRKVELTKTAEPVRKVELLRNTRVGEINLAIPKTKRATASPARVTKTPTKTSLTTRIVAAAPTAPITRIAKRRGEDLESPKPVKKNKRCPVFNIISDSEISDVEENAQFEGENEKIFNNFINLTSLTREGAWKLMMREKMLFNKAQQGK